MWLETEFQSDDGSANGHARRSKQWQNHSPPIAALRSAPTSFREIAFPDAVDIYLWLCQAGLRPQKQILDLVRAPSKNDGLRRAGLMH